MHAEFVKNTQKFSIKKSVEAIEPDEAIVKFKDSREIQTFFNNAMKNRMNSDSIHRMADRIAPSYIRRSLKSPPPLSERERLDFLFSEIAKGNANVVLKNNAFQLEPKKSSPPEDEEKGFFESIDLFKIAERQMNHLKEVYSKIVHTDYYFLEQVIRVPEDIPLHTSLVVIEPSTVKEHSTGWKDWDIPFEYKMFGALKALAVFDLALITKLGNSAFLAAAGGYISEGVKCQYNITGKFNCL